MSTLDEDIKKELNNLKQCELIQIFFEKNIDNITLSEPLNEYFTKVFSTENNPKSSCFTCSEIKEEVKIIKREVEECKKACIKLDKGLRAGDFRDLTRSTAASTRLVKNEDVQNSKGRCDFNEIGDKMGIKTSSSEVYTLSQIENELKQFYEYCKENNLSDGEIANICKTLLPPIKGINTKYIQYFAIFLIVLATLYLLSYVDGISWHYAAIGRIFLIELLPIWNWNEWKTERCLVNSINNRDLEAIDPIQDCTFCEYIKRIDAVDAFRPDVIYDKYIKIHKPLILENGLENWMETIKLETLLETILDDDVLAESVPCKFKSNTFHGNANLYQSLKDVRDNELYFAHFQNCEFNAVKAFRKYFNRPKFLAAEILPIQYSWVLMSKKYDVEKYKPVLLTDQIAIVGQFSGKTHIRLHPNECANDCDSIKMELATGEVLIFSGLWNMEYKPNSEFENVAVILETH